MNPSTPILSYPQQSLHVTINVTTDGAPPNIVVFNCTNGEGGIVHFTNTSEIVEWGEINWTATC